MSGWKRVGTDERKANALLDEIERSLEHDDPLTALRIRDILAKRRESSAPLEVGAGEIRIKLSRGTITVWHGSAGAKLAELKDAPYGTWGKIWESLDNLGFVRTIQGECE